MTTANLTMMSDVILLSDAMYMTSVLLYVSFYIIIVQLNIFNNHWAIHYKANLSFG